MRTRAVPWPLDFRACVHDDIEAGSLPASGRLLIDNAKLEPDTARADRDRLIDVLPGLSRATEDVDHIDRKIDLGEASVAFLAKYRFGQRIDRHDPHAVGLQECRYAVGSSIFVTG
jgi:hypothetical protein